MLITDLYERRCAITGQEVLPILESVHIRPVDEGGQHRVDNGLLLRSDLRRLFQRGYISISPEYTVMVSPQLEQDYKDANSYQELDGRQLHVPIQPVHRPRREFLQWHVARVFRS